MTRDRTGMDTSGVPERKKKRGPEEEKVLPQGNRVFPEDTGRLKAPGRQALRKEKDHVLILQVN